MNIFFTILPSLALENTHDTIQYSYPYLWIFIDLHLPFAPSHSQTLFRNDEQMKLDDAPPPALSKNPPRSIQGCEFAFLSS